MRLFVVSLAENRKVTIRLALELGLSSLISDKCKLPKALVVTYNMLSGPQDLNKVVEVRWILLKFDRGTELAKNLRLLVQLCLELKIRNLCNLVGRVSLAQNCGLFQRNMLVVLSHPLRLKLS